MDRTFFVFTGSSVIKSFFYDAAMYVCYRSPELIMNLTDVRSEEQKFGNNFALIFYFLPTAVH